MSLTTETATVTTKGQITIPIEVRREMSLIPGSKLDFIPDQDGTWRVVKRKRSIMELAGFLKWEAEPISIEEMDEKAKRQVIDTYHQGIPR